MLLAQHYPVTCHTDHVGAGSTFVAIPGFKTDGTQFIATALEHGATTIIVQETSITEQVRALCAQHNAALITVPDARRALAEHAATALGNPASKLKIIGITGTKGKTTTAFLVDAILRKAGHKTALISSVYNKIINNQEPCTRTTPEADYVQMFLAACVNQNVQYVVMEVSSHALDLHRVAGITFDAVGFTNLAQDHLDYHHTMDEYFNAKAAIFSRCKPGGTIAINSDNSWGQQAAHAAQTLATAGQQIVTFGANDNPSAHQVTMHIHQATCDGIELVLDLKPGLFIDCPQLFGTFNCYNIALASILAHSVGVAYTFITKALATFAGVPGRLQRHVLQNGALAFVDYAHMPLAVQEILTTLRPFTNHLIVVFGCGGDKPKDRRPGMGAAAGKYADEIILTDDNPRTEDRMAIVNDIIAGIAPEHRHKVHVELDRRKAIARAAQRSGSDTIIALLGKGHQKEYILGTTSTHFDDLEEIGKF